MESGRFQLTSSLLAELTKLCEPSVFELDENERLFCIGRAKFITELLLKQAETDVYNTYFLPPVVPKKLRSPSANTTNTTKIKAEKATGGSPPGKKKAGRKKKQ